MNISNMQFKEFQEEKIKELTSSRPWMEQRDMRLISSIEELSHYIDEAIEAGICALDIETTGLSTRVKRKKNTSDNITLSTSDYEPVNKIVGFCLSFDSKCGVYVPINHIEDPHENLPERQTLLEIQRLCKNCRLIFHNAKFDLQVLRNYGIIVDSHEKFEDTLILARLHDAGRKEIGLKNLSEHLLNQPMLSFKDVCKEERFDFISPRIGYQYGSSDAICTLDLYNFFIATNIIKEQMPVYNLEKRTTLVVLQMERSLLKIDVSYLKELQISIAQRLREIEQEIYRLAGKEFNIASPPQLGRILFEELNYNYPEKKKTASGQYMTDTHTLEKIKDVYPIVGNIIEYRMLEKSLGTYVNNLLTNYDEDGYIKLSFKQSGTDTGRFSSPGGKGIRHDGYCGVNVQSIPSNYDEGVPDIRKAIVARPGNKIVAMDYSSEELRVATNLSGEPRWIEALESGVDLHTATGRVIFGRQEISKAERQIAKTVNFLTLYGGGAKTLAAQAGISEREAKRVLNQFFTGLAHLKKWIDRERARARQRGFAQTSFGRIRPLHMFYNTGRDQDVAHADRCAVNFLVQGASADIMKTAMVRVFNWIKSSNLIDEIKLLITMHDEIVFEMPENKLDFYIPKLNNIMKLEDILQGHLHWRIPLKVDAEYGDSWHVDHDFFKEHPELENSSETVVFHKSTQIVEESNKENFKEQVPEQAPSEQEKLPENTIVTGEQNDLPEQKESSEVPIPSPEISTETLIYTLRDRRASTLRRLNDILSFLQGENNKEVKYSSPLKILQIRDVDGNLLSIDKRIRADAFLALARREGL